MKSVAKICNIQADSCNFVQMTIPQMKAWLQGKNMSVGGKKADLVERVEEFFEQK